MLDMWGDPVRSPPSTFRPVSPPPVPGPAKDDASTGDAAVCRKCTSLRRRRTCVRALLQHARQGTLTDMESEVWSRWEEVVASEEPDPLEVIMLASRLHGYLSAVEARAVSAARAQGASWQDIAAAAGTTRQSAWEKWRAVERLAEGVPDRFSPELFAVRRAAAHDALVSVAQRKRPNR